MRAVTFALWLAGCAAPDADRQSWLVDQLQLDNARWLARDPELLRAKYRRMRDDPYDFMRGTAAVGVADWTRSGPERTATAFARSVGARTVLLAGDPHPENLGTLYPGGDLLHVEVNDLDGGTWGPYTWDVRRGALGLGVLLVGAGCDGDCLDLALTAYARAYAEQIAHHAAGGTWARAFAVDSPAPAIARDALDRAWRDGASDRVLREETELGPDGARRFVRDDAFDEVGRADLELSPDEAAQVDRLTRTLGLAPRDAVRRYGQGIASMPAVRVMVLVGGPGPDERVIQLREVIDALPMPGWDALVDGGFEDDGDRVVRVSQALWSRPDADPALASARDGAMAFKVTGMSGYHVGFSHTRIQGLVARGRIDADALIDWSGWLGAHLGAVHAGAPTRDGGSALSAIAADLDGRTDDWVDERTADALTGVDDLLRDHALFVGALARLGPDLGAR